MNKVFLLLLLWALPLQAQELILNRQSMSLLMAQHLIDSVLQAAEKENIKVAVVVLDQAGLLVAAVRADDARPYAVEIAHDKAQTALNMGVPSSEFVKRVEKKPELHTTPHAVPLAGGVPISVNNQVIGALGISGAPDGMIDEMIAKQAVTLVLEDLNHQEATAAQVDADSKEPASAVQALPAPQETSVANTADTGESQ